MGMCKRLFEPRPQASLRSSFYAASGRYARKRQAQTGRRSGPACHFQTGQWLLILIASRSTRRLPDGRSDRVCDLQLQQPIISFMQRHIGDAAETIVGMCLFVIERRCTPRIKQVLGTRL
ncbi:uncharacterized protein UMAG_00821 [Mycosarcoma maydis]|uniref:Uncharacterized protein n=1 Tax=Mycosarcoma maydis TaxID=5270 RepID=A0A0D1CHJ5_MYCMD|nr:uncharacterized protein UMAG_00821 [Ustilago maydis 521]KIS72422.1 hypothetical protein UMAG_00821 [Ustilago maydis 521]|eukprot:XP_011386584.1 hypothetical protein UMAG_00821 [Ustilago maydis 521]